MLNKVLRIHESEERRMNFAERDLVGIMDILEINAPVFAIYRNENESQEIYGERISRFLDVVDKESAIILVSADVKNNDIPAKVKIMRAGESLQNELDKVISEKIDEGMKTIEPLGFESINFFVKYEHSVPYIYMNSFGYKIITYMRNC